MDEDLLASLLGQIDDFGISEREVRDVRVCA